MKTLFNSPIIKTLVAEADGLGMLDEVEYMVKTHLEDVSETEDAGSLDYETDSHDRSVEFARAISKEALKNADIELINVTDVHLSQRGSTMTFTIKD